MTVKRSRRAITLRQKMMKKMNLHKMNTLQRQRPVKMSRVGHETSQLPWGQGMVTEGVEMVFIVILGY